MKALVALALIGGGEARADVCLEGDGEAAMRMIERHAKVKSAHELELPSGSSAWICAAGDAVRLHDRIVAACTVILDRDGDDSPCNLPLATAGVAKLGKHDVFAFAAAFDPDPLNSGGTYEREAMFEMLRAMKDARAVPLVLDRWRTAEARVVEIEKLPRSSERRGSALGNWSSFRQAAAALLGELGGADEQAFLEGQAKATRDPHVAEACRDGAAAIAKRLKGSARPEAPEDERRR